MGTATPAAVLRANGTQVTVAADPFGIGAGSLFGVARRVNPRRSVLFVSTVLGKHVAVDPSVALLAAAALGVRLAEVHSGRPHHRRDRIAPALSDPAAAAALLAELRADPCVLGGPAPLVLGFAETATALGHGVRDVLAGAHGISTTRVVDSSRPPLFGFSEEHSHATAHRVVARDSSWFADDRLVVLVDDEMTTGTTACNTIAALHAVAPRSRYAVAVLLDWRGERERAAFADLERRIGARIDVVSLVEGQVDTPLVDPPSEEAVAVRQSSEPAAPSPEPAEVRVTTIPVRVPVTGRYGWSPVDQEAAEPLVVDIASHIDAARTGGPALCLGSEEFMYLPQRVAAAMDGDVRTASTTRSPVRVEDRHGYPVRSSLTFPSPTDPAATAYVYNVTPGRYRDVIVLLDEPPPSRALAGLRAAFTGLGAGTVVHLVALDTAS